MANAEEIYYRHAHGNARKRQYTSRILSTPGNQDGLYWEVPADQPSSPLGRLNEFAQDVVESTQPGAAPVFDGYSFRITTGQNNKSFTIVATPVNYGDSGIMTFILTKDGQVLQKDLGANTASLVSSIISYSPNQGWMQAE